MAALLSWSLLTIQIFLFFLSAGFARSCFKRASDVSQSMKRLHSLEADILEQASRLDKLYELCKRLSQRQALADYKSGANKTVEEPVSGSNDGLTKEQLRRKLFAGKNHIDIARMASGGVDKNG